MIYTALHTLRVDHDLTQDRTGFAIEVRQRTYSYYENGERMLPPNILCALADFYGVTVDALLGRVPLPPLTPTQHNQLETLRLKTGKSHQELADLLGCSHAEYCGYEFGVRVIPGRALKSLSDFYNVSVQSLLSTK